MREFLRESSATATADLDATQRAHAKAMANAYVRLCRDPITASRYMPEEYMKLQGVRSDLIAPALAKVRKKYEA